MSYFNETPIPMHLKQLKLAGFKSFVDPTVVYFPSQLVGIVGPNGCGKSNIIDAVRWVMGESSAKNLRGESMADVIFNGSTHRKSLGQASVELVFDNRLGRLGGPFASYAELSLKRVVSRDGDSSYFLNGSPCRRKDITDIFLGTGAGSRSYSIIGQGTISQLIEAKPEELRVFLEEAAGVSKYKERKRETLQRIAHTRDNLTRVADIREELEKQVHRLECQAQTARRYLMLKEKEQQCRAEILALKWKAFITQREEKLHQVQNLVLSYEQQQSELARANKERIIIHDTLHEVDEYTQEIQSTFYQLGTEIVRLEESIQQQAREKSRLDQDKHQVQEEGYSAEEELSKDKEELEQALQKAHTLDAQLEQLKAQFNVDESNWQEIKQQQSQWDLRWEELQNQRNHWIRALQTVQINSDHLEKQQQNTLLRLEKIKLDQESLSAIDGGSIQNALEEEHIQLIAHQQKDELQLKQSLSHTEQLRHQLQKIEQQIHELQDQFHSINSEHAALTAAQSMARQSMQQNKKEIKAWEDKPRLMDLLQVEEKWQYACERILNEALHAYVLENLDELEPQQEVCARQGESVVLMNKAQNKSSTRSRLIDTIQSEIPAHLPPLDSIYTAENLEEALNGLADLTEYESIITPEGFWLGSGWVKFVSASEQDELGFLARHQKIKDLSSQIPPLQKKITELRIERDKTHQEIQNSIKDNELHRLNVHTSNEAVRTNTNAMNANKQAMDQAEKQAANLAFECSELSLLLEELAQEQSTLQEQQSALKKEGEDKDKIQEEFQAQKQKWVEVLALKSKEIEEIRALLYDAELEYDKEKNKIHQIKTRIQNQQDHLDRLKIRLEHLVQLVLQAENPGTDLKEQLAQQLQKQAALESQLIVSREQLAQLRMKLEEYEKNILNCDEKVKRIQELINQVRMEEQALAVRASSVEESLEELGVQAKQILDHIPIESTQSMREDELIALSEKIKELGAINLAAIEEYETEQQRKDYLDEQYADLSEALTTLETAIEKMDKETRLRLEHTFAEVNTSFQSLFPRLFGGGKAALELTCDNMLEAGIMVMAQPPGKRNSTIHLLSGGEKAMTAVALVFALFQLNPSPFCMLDEVDAPLDDVNVGRFCTLVKEMSQFVQFLFITHNKVTMKLADHLIGVTMREPGVSRLVAVDVTQALATE
jgi:chromosome segregation protein